MSKESEVLKKLNLIQKVFEKLADWNAYDLAKLDKDYETNFDLDFLEIERSLKELEERREMMKKFNDACIPMILDNETEKKLKALEIIKEKKVFVANLIYHFERDDNVIEYNQKCGWAKSELTQEEYDLLKEVLL